MRKKKKEATLGEDIVNGLQEIIDYKKGKISLKSTIVEIPKPPTALSPDEIQDIRENKLNMSQAVFAGFLGVSPATVKAWEHGLNVPKGPALRLLHLALVDRQSFLKVANVG